MCDLMDLYYSFNYKEPNKAADMIKIRLTGTQSELTQAIAITRQNYNVLSRSTPRKVKPDSSEWTIAVNADFKSATVAISPSSPETRQKHA